MAREGSPTGGKEEALRDTGARARPSADDAPEATADLDNAPADPTLIQSMLRLTPEERLDVLQGFVNSVWELRHGDGKT